MRKKYVKVPTRENIVAREGQLKLTCEPTTETPCWILNDDGQNWIEYGVDTQSQAVKNFIPEVGKEYTICYFGKYILTRELLKNCSRHMRKHIRRNMIKG